MGVGAGSRLRNRSRLFPGVFVLELLEAGWNVVLFQERSLSRMAYDAPAVGIESAQVAVLRVAETFPFPS